MNKNPFLSFGILWSGIFILSACASAFKPSGFLSHSDDLKKGEYFRQEWIADGEDFSRFTKAKVSEVDISHFDNSVSRHSEEEIKTLASDFKQKLETGLAPRFQILPSDERADDETLVFAPALLYVATPERAINAATAWFFNFSISKGFAACEVKLTDGATGEVIAEVAEKRTGGAGIKDVKSLTVGSYMKFAHAEGAFKAWAESLSKLTTSSK